VESFRSAGAWKVTQDGTAEAQFRARKAHPPGLCGLFRFSDVLMSKAFPAWKTFTRSDRKTVGDA
jgi:hypothetical protein